MPMQTAPTITASPVPAPPPAPPRATRYVVVDSAAAMPSSCWGVYRRVGVLEVAASLTDAQVARLSIDARRRGVVRVVSTWERCNVGSTARCAFRRALDEARAEADVLNGTRPSTPPPFLACTLPAR